MPFEYVDGAFVWVGAEGQPQIGETKIEYAQREMETRPIPKKTLGSGDVFRVQPWPLEPDPTRPDLGVAKWTDEGFQRKDVGEVLQAGLPLAGLAAGALTAWQLWEEWQGGGGSGINGGASMANGVDLYGRSGSVDGMPVGGWGVPEPPAAMVAKQWKTKAFSKTVGEYWVYFFRLVDGRIMCWNEAKKTWKIWRPKKPLAVMYRGKTTLSQAVKVQSYLDKLWKTVAKRTKAIKLA